VALHGVAMRAWSDTGEEIYTYMRFFRSILFCYLEDLQKIF
jgi:hypothetical protein